ncbi:MAG: AAA family ATPase [bacterium]
MIINFQNLSVRNLEPVESKKQTPTSAVVSTPIVSNSESPKVSLLDKNYNSLLVQKNNLNFGAKVLLSTKITAIMQAIGEQDLVLIGENQKTAINLLKESISSIPKVIKTFMMIEDKNIKGAIAITQEDGLNYFHNLNKNPITVKNVEADEVFEKGDSFLVNEGDKLIIDGVEIPIIDEFEKDLAKVRELTVKQFDFSKQDLATITKLNVRRLEQLSGEASPDAITEKKLTFADVGGQDEAIAQLKKSIIYPIKYPAAFKNQILNRGTLLVGDPGNGKTLLAKAVANEVDAHYIELNGLELETKWIGETEEKWRSLFSEAKEHQPSIIFIDEIDGVGRERDGSTIARYDNKVVNQLLTLMSDLEKGKFGNVHVIAASNKLQIIDGSLVRSGRFGTHVPVKNPDLKGVKHIFNIHSKNKPLSDEFNADAFTQKLHNQKSSGADIAKIANDAHTNAYLRAGIFDKMESGTFEQNDIDSLRIKPEDFEKALTDFQNQETSKKDRLVVTGYKRYPERT